MHGPNYCLVYFSVTYIATLRSNIMQLIADILSHKLCYCLFHYIITIKK